MKLIGVAILLVAQACLVIQWLAQTAWHYAIAKPWRHYQELRSDAAEWRDHVCIDTDPLAAVPGRQPIKVWDGIPSAGRHAA